MRLGRSILLAALGCAVLAAVALAIHGRRNTVRSDRGPVGERILARGVVVPTSSVRNVYAENDAKIVRAAVREGDVVASGQLLAELKRGDQTDKLTAPIAGVILERHCEAGDYALAAEHGAQQPLFALVDPSRTELRIEVEEADAAALTVGLAARASANAAGRSSVSGHVSRVSARLERRTIGADDARVRAEGLVRGGTVTWDGERPAWPLGARADVVLQVRHRDATIRVPRSALSVRDGRHVVEQPLAFWTREVPVEVLAVDDAYAEVRGLAPGSEVVVPDAEEP
jgi:multidrug efflux pump subunit AcrA (membrane-fusion protein)